MTAKFAARVSAAQNVILGKRLRGKSGAELDGVREVLDPILGAGSDAEPEAEGQGARALAAEVLVVAGYTAPTMIAKPQPGGGH